MQDSYTNTSGTASNFLQIYSNTSSQNAYAYFAEMVYVDGQQLDADLVLENGSATLTDNGRHRNVSGLTFGNNGFYLDFEIVSS